MHVSQLSDPFIGKVNLIRKNAQYLFKIKQMFLSLLFVLFFVFGNGCYTQSYRTEMSYVMSDAFRSKT